MTHPPLAEITYQSQGWVSHLMQSCAGTWYIKTMENDKSTKVIHPTRHHLVELWMKTHHPGAPAAVFFNPLADDGEALNLSHFFRIQDLVVKLKLNDDQVEAAILCDVFIHPIRADELCTFVHRMDQDVYGYVMAWDGTEFISHN